MHLGCRHVTVVLRQAELFGYWHVAMWCISKAILLLQTASRPLHATAELMPVLAYISMGGSGAIVRASWHGSCMCLHGHPNPQVSPVAVDRHGVSRGIVYGVLKAFKSIHSLCWCWLGDLHQPSTLYHVMVLSKERSVRCAWWWPAQMAHGVGACAACGISLKLHVCLQHWGRGASLARRRHRTRALCCFPCCHNSPVHRRAVLHAHTTLVT